MLEVCFSLLRKSHGYKVGPHMLNPVTMARAISAIVSFMQGQSEKKSYSFTKWYRMSRKMLALDSFTHESPNIIYNNLINKLRSIKFLIQTTPR